MDYGYANIEGVNKLISEVVRQAIITYITYNYHSYKLTHKLQDNNNYKDKIRIKKDGTEIILPAQIQIRDDKAKLEYMQGEMDYILRWLESDNFNKLVGYEINGTYIKEKLLATDHTAYKQIRVKKKKSFNWTNLL